MSFISHDDIEYLPPAPAPETKRPLGSNSFAQATTLTPGALSLPEDLWNAGQQTNDFINGMSAAVAAVTNWKGHNVPPGTGAAFDAFRKEWAEFYGNNLSSRPQLIAHAFTSNLSGNLRNYQEQAATWAKNLKKWGVIVPASRLRWPAAATSSCGSASAPSRSSACSYSASFSTPSPWVTPR